MTLNHTLVIGHRGASAQMPENTLPAFETAFDACRADMIEFDVRLSRDRVPVVIHDETLARTTDGTGKVSDYTLKELRKLDAGYRFDPEGKGLFPERGKGIVIPTLEEVIAKFAGRRLAIELKDISEELVSSVLKLVKDFSAESHTIVGSLHDAVFRMLAKRVNETGVRLFTSRGKVFRLLTDFSFGRNRHVKEPFLVASMPVKSRFFDLKRKPWIDWLHGKEITVYYWTVNDPALMRMLYERGADGIMSDDPGLLGRTLGLSPGTVPKDG